MVLRRVGRAIWLNHAETSPHDADPRLRGRTYAIPFEQVWQAVGRLASGGLRRWRLIASDDHDGIIHAEARTLFGKVDDVLITISLDADAQTRVDVQARARQRSGDLGRNARRIGKFCRSLDQRLRKK
ncbi:MAG TPA: DUF1499 domain-containing protein [Lysobacter sp.]|nr:DUF1499 domain-containing protein [Lysobacter sp.]